MTVAKSPPDREEEIRQAYLRVSHAFEGGREHRAELYEDYLQFFDDDDVVLDFGCGDGTWLELLASRGIDALGIDYDGQKVAECRRRGLRAVQSDDLNDAAAERPTALTAFHIIEHLPPMEVMRLLMTLDVRKVILVTPNIDHPPVLSSFWRDVTHVRPYPCDVVAEMCRQAGFPGIISGTQNNDWDSWAFGYKPGTPEWPAP
jgi:SAM-dependent methyltransferase